MSAGWRNSPSGSEIKHFIDHGPTVEEREQVRDFQAKYAELYSKAKHTVAKPGDKIPFGPVDVQVVTSAKQVIKTPLKGGGIPNPACAEFKARDDSDTQAENKQSVGVVYSYGKYRSVNLGDFTFNEEQELMCPNNPIGHVSLFLTSHHGINQSNSVALVHGLAPTVAIMHNSTRKGGALTTMQALWTSPGLQDVWQLHWAYAAGLDYNTPGLFIANPEDPATVAGVITGAIPAGFGGVGRGPGPGGPASLLPAHLRKPRRAIRASRWPAPAVRPGGSGGPGAGARRPYRPGVLFQSVGAFGRFVHGNEHAQQLQQNLQRRQVKIESGLEENAPTAWRTSSNRLPTLRPRRHFRRHRR